MLRREDAVDQLKAAATQDWEAQRLTAIARLARPLRTAGFGLL